MPCAEKGLILTPVRPGDKRFLFELANDTAVRAASFQSDAIPWEQHCRWFSYQTAQGYPFYIGLLNNSPCGYARFRPTPDSPDEAEVSIAVHGIYRGRGVGTHLLDLACRKLLAENHISRIGAWIKKDNLSSLRIFLKNKFQITHTTTINGNEALYVLYSNTG